MAVALACILFDGGNEYRLGPVPVRARPDRHHRRAGHVPDRDRRRAARCTWRSALPGMSRCWWRRRSRRPTRRWCSRSLASGRSPAGRHHFEGGGGRERPGGDRADGEPDRGGWRQCGRVRSGRRRVCVANGGRGDGWRGGRPALLWFTRRVPLPSEGLYPLRTLACVLCCSASPHSRTDRGSWPCSPPGSCWPMSVPRSKREIEAFHAALASLAEIVAFIVLGLTIDLAVIARADVWIPGLILGTALAVVIRPVLVGLCLVPARLKATSAPSSCSPGSRGRADPAGQLPARRARARCRTAVRHRRRRGGVLRGGAGSLTPRRPALLVPVRVMEPGHGRWGYGSRWPSGVHRLAVPPAHLPTPHHRRPARPAWRRLDHLHRARRPARSPSEGARRPRPGTMSWSWHPNCTTFWPPSSKDATAADPLTSSGHRGRAARNPTSCPRAGAGGLGFSGRA